MYLNQGPQDQLLFCSDRSYFTNTGYTCTTNFQLEYRDVDPVSTAKLGSTARFVIPKAADLLGHVDLLATVKAADAGGMYDGGDNNEASAWYWVNKLGFAMIEKITMTIGSNLIEEITGEQLDLINELMREGKDKLGWHTIMRDCKPASSHVHDGRTSVTAMMKGQSGLHAGGDSSIGGTLQAGRGFSRLISATGATSGDIASDVGYGTEHKLIVPLGLFFSKHASQYFPLGAIAGCNDVVLEIKFRPLAHLRAFNHDKDGSGAVTKPTVGTNGEFVQDIKLRCTYVHLTGPEAALQMNKEHVRLMRQWKNLNFTKSLPTTTNYNWQVDLSFLHPVSFLVITFRKTDHIDQADETASNNAAEKGYFQYYGDGRVPTLDHAHGNTTTAKDNLKLNSISLTLNGQERHPGLTANKLDNHYLKYRVLPQMFSSSDHSEELLEHLDHNLSHTISAAATSTSTSTVTSDAVNSGGSAATTTVATSTTTTVAPDLALHNTDIREALQAHRHELLGAKNVYVYPFCIHPEGANPSGSVNFSKVSHAKLSCNVDIAAEATPEWRMDVYAVGYNWLQIKDGRGLLSFA